MALRNNQKTKTASQFPSEFVDPKIKLEDAYMAAYSKAFHYHASFGLDSQFSYRFNSEFPRHRKYGRGEQSKNQYKERQGLKANEQGKLNPSYKNLSWEILKVAPKMIHVLLGRMFNTTSKLSAELIDAQGIMDQKTYEAFLKEAFLNQAAVEEVKKNAGVQIDDPFANEEVPPQSLEDVEEVAKRNPKNALPRETTDIVNYVLQQNDWEQISWEVMDDLITVGVGAAFRGIGPDGLIKLKRGIPERIVTNTCRFDDFRDMYRIAEYEEITVGDLRTNAKGKFTEQQLFDIAKNAAKKANSKQTYPGGYSEYYRGESHNYQYDIEKFTIMHVRFLSTDSKKYQIIKNEEGNNRLRERSYDWVPYKGDKGVNEGRGYSVAEYNKEFEGKAKIKQNEYRNGYKCTWVVDTDHIYDSGKITDQEKNLDTLGHGNLGWSLYTTGNQSTVGNIENVLDMIQLNWLQFQSHIASSKPKGIMIEMRSIAGRKKKGQGGQTFDPKEALKLYSETGNVVFNGYDRDGQPLPWLPIQELNNGLSPDAFKHFEIIIGLIDMLRQLLGTNGIVDGEQAAPRTSNMLGQMAVMGSDNALTYLKKAFRSIHEGTANGIMNLIPNMYNKAEKDGLIEKALGVETKVYFDIFKDLTLRKIGISFEEVDHESLKERIFQLISNPEMSGLSPEEAIEIQMLAERNPEKALRRIKIMKKIRAKEAKEADSQKNAEIAGIEADKVDSAVSAELKKAQGLADIEVKKETQLSELRKKEDDNKGQWDVKVAHIQANDRAEDRKAREDESRRKNDTDLIGKHLQNEGALEREEFKAANAPKPETNTKPKTKEK